MSTEGNSAQAFELEELLRRLEEARGALMEALETCDPAVYNQTNVNGDSVRRILERTSDEINFYYGRLAARALKLPQPPCLEKADFLSLREAKISLQVAHRRFTNLLHDLVPTDLERTATDEDGSAYTLRQILAMAAAQYRLRAQQLQRIAQEAARAR
jgi:hypothetical protein